MGAVIVLLSGVVGLLLALASYFMGFGILASLAVYAVSGHLLTAWLLWRMARDEEDGMILTQETIEADLLALREMEERRAARGSVEILDGPSIFGLLRNRAVMAESGSARFRQLRDVSGD